MLLATTDGDTPAYQELRELAAHKLPEVNALISRAEAMRDWLTTATGCGCESLDVCALFEDGAADSLKGASADELVLQLSHVRP